MGFKINLHVTQKCNYNCKYCFAHFADIQDLSVETWKMIIDNIKQSRKIDAINLLGASLFCTADSMRFWIMHIKKASVCPSLATDL